MRPKKAAIRKGRGFLLLCVISKEVIQQIRREAAQSRSRTPDMMLTTLKPRVQTLKASRVQQIEGTKRISGNSLYAIMKRFERTHPRICAECRRQGLVGFGDELDHIIPLHLGGKEADSNRQWLCREHHAEKTAREASDRAAQW